jgi:spermidine synthase
MTRPWETLDAADTPEGRLELRRRGPAESGEFVLTVGGRVLMNSLAHRTEVAAAEVACRRVAGRPKLGGARVLIGGLGMGFTLRAALDALPRDARVTVAEIDPTLVRWCRGPLAPLTRNALDDPRVEVAVADVTLLIAAGVARPWDVIVLDLYEGPRAATQGREDPFYGKRALAATRAALAPGGLFAVWSEDADAAFEKRLAGAGFRVERLRPGKGGPRHVVYLGVAASGASSASDGERRRSRRRREAGGKGVGPRA